jgi:hypothetical protein
MEYRVHEKIAETTRIVERNGETVVLCEIFRRDTTDFRISEHDGVYSMNYISKYWYNPKEPEFNKPARLYWHYDFYFPVEAIGKGDEVMGYEDIYDGTDFDPETTVILRVKM